MYRLKTLNPSFRGVVFDYLIRTLYFNEMNYKNFTYNICKQRFLPSFIVFYMRKNFYLAEDLNKHIGSMKSSGLIVHYVSKYLGKTKSKAKNTQIAPSPMTLNQLEGVFQIWVYCSAFTLLVFACEFICTFLQNKMCLRTYPIEIEFTQ